MTRSLIAPGGIIVVSLFLLWQTFGITSSYAASDLYGPAFFPRAILGGLIIISALQIASEAMRRRTSPDRPEPRRLDPVAFGVTLAAGGLYVVAMEYVGFVPATLVFQAVILSAVFGMRSLAGIVLMPGLLTAIYFAIFVRILELPLPQGRGVFRDLSQLIYY